MASCEVLGTEDALCEDRKRVVIKIFPCASTLVVNIVFGAALGTRVMLSRLILPLLLSPPPLHFLQNFCNYAERIEENNTKAV